jgi:trigger factor
LKSEIKSSDGLKREVEVEIPVDRVNAAFSKQYDKLRKEAKIKGFRPGKAPLAMIKSMYGDSVRGEVFQELISESYPDVIKEHSLKVASQPDFPKFDLKEGQPMTYTVAVEVMPEIDDVNYDGLQLPDDKIEVHDTEIDSVVDYLRKKQAEIKKVDRAATEDDILLVDMEKIDDPDNALKEKEFKDYEIELGGGYTVKEFKEGLTGARVGDSREITVAYPEDYSVDFLKGKKIKYLCKVKEVRERILPPADDAFAKSQGNVATMLELRLKVREDLTKQKEMDQFQWRKEEIRRQMLEKNKIDVPGAMRENFIDSIIEEYKEKNRNFDEKEVREQYRPLAEDGIRWNLLFERITGAENIEVLPSDTENWIKGFAEKGNMEIEKARELLSNSGKIREIRNNILEDKVFEFLISRAELVPITPVSQELDKAVKEQTADENNKITEENK